MERRTGINRPPAYKKRRRRRTNIGSDYFKHALYSPVFFSLRNAVCFIMLTCLVPVLFIFYLQGVLKLKENNSGAKGLRKEEEKGVNKEKLLLVFSCLISTNSNEIAIEKLLVLICWFAKYNFDMVN